MWGWAGEITRSGIKPKGGSTELNEKERRSHFSNAAKTENSCWLLIGL